MQPTISFIHRTGVPDWDYAMARRWARTRAPVKPPIEAIVSTLPAGSPAEFAHFSACPEVAGAVRDALGMIRPVAKISKRLDRDFCGSTASV